MISIRHLKFAYSNSSQPNLVIDHLTINQGECVVLCGKSGSGKTTFTRLLNGLIPEYYQGKLEGETMICGMQLGQQSVEEFSQKVASVFQNPATQFFHRKVEHELVFPCENLGLAPEEIQERLARTVAFFEIKNLLTQDLLRTSGGERQCIALMTATMQNPNILILDEPSANLDQLSVMKLKNHLKQLKSMGVTIIIAEHRLDFLKNLGDTYLYFDNGKISRIWSRQEWLLLTDSQRQRQGLRGIETIKLFDRPVKIAQGDLEVSALSLVAGKQRLGHIEDIVFPSGAITALLGKNGIGKSSFARVLSGLVKANGHIILDNQKISEADRLKATAYVMQDACFQLFSDSVKKELLLGNSKTKDYREIAKLLDLTNLLERHPVSLSGGEQQRVLIGNALLSDKKIFIFDEPTSGLDYDHMIAAAKLLEQLKKQGKIIIVITHDKELINEVCDYRIDLSECLTKY